MTTPQQVQAPPGPDGDERPWYELISDVPEIPEDAMEQEDIVLHVRSILWERYAADPGALVAGPLANLIYDSATPGSVVAPDVFVVFGVEEQTIKLHRRSYRIDEWGQTPVFVLEVASESTARNDLREKRRIYARIGVPEYWRLDRWGDYYGEPLAGEHLVDGEYRPLELHRESNGDTWSRSEVLGVDFYYRIEDGVGQFLLRDSASGEWLNDLRGERAVRLASEARAEAAQARTEAAQAQAEAAQAQAEAAEARNRELIAELQRLRDENR